ncbi:MAG: SCP2 domain-containing protein [Nitrincola lacisaponensis]|uniref:Ubiquinone biosynthesis accessory factor UbiJ n=1 Tax=Nitrincola lacisaponensis TaxID=267850 RepID=A0A063Y676_9GAMM|nr:SCP2 sterol-binding domain-containing protein [Nitrincola lacisaponensis]KDE40261.1 YigP protein [Nitrincola lacisaponensis]
MPVELLSATLIGTAEASLNLLLKKDPATRQRLAALSGKVIRLEMEQPRLNLTLLPGQAGLDLLLNSEAVADLTLSGKASDFMLMLQQQHAEDKLFGKGIDLQGDTGLATQFSQAIKGFKLDWEAWLADLIGDTAAHPLAHFLHQQGQYWQQAGQSLTQNTSEYLQEELRLLPPRAEIEQFIEDIEQLRDDVARLEARINALNHPS